MADGHVLDAFPERQRAMNELVKAVGEFKLKAAQAELTEAVAADRSWTPVRILGVEPIPAEKRILESNRPKAAE